MHLSKLNAVVSIMASGLAFSGTMGSVCTPGNVTVPCATNSWGINASALYLQANYSGALSYLGSLSADYVKNNPDWSWGFDIGASYYFNTGNDVSVNWYHIASPTTTRAADYIFDVPLVQSTFAADTTSIRPNWDAVNFEVGQIVNMGASKSVRFHGGFQYARIATDLSYLGITGGDFDTEEMQYSGFGPRLGVDLSYYFTPVFSVYAKTATAVLVGSSKTNSIRGTIAFPSPTVTYINRTEVVPEVDLKLGLQYDYALTNNHLMADAGYMWVNYFSPIEQLSATLTNYQSSNFSLQGLYFGLKWVGTV